MTDLIRQSLTLTQEDWDQLDKLAVQFNTCPPSGVTAGKPSWRSLIKEIARGEIVLSRHETTEEEDYN
jgi:hypothetical protein